MKQCFMERAYLPSLYHARQVYASFLLTLSSKYLDCTTMKKISSTTIFDGVMQLVTQKKIFLCASHLVENSTPPPPPAELNLSASTKTILSSLVINDDALNLLNPQDPPYITLPVELHLQSASTKTILSSLEIEDEPLNLLDPKNLATILHLMSSTSLR